MNLNKKYDESTAMSEVRVNLSLCTMRELHELRKTIDNELAIKAKRHNAAIRSAIEAAKHDGFSIVISPQGDNDNMVYFTPNDENGVDVYID